MLKRELEKLVGDKNAENFDLANAVRKLTNERNKAQDELKGSQNKLSLEVNRLVEIRNAIETIGAVKFPGASFENENTPFMSTPVQMASQSAEPDELLALRHIYKLTGW